MNNNRVRAFLMAILLLLLNVSPVFALDSEQNGLLADSGKALSEIVDSATQPPAIDLAFSAWVKSTVSGPRLIGCFPGISPDMTRVQPFYSFDGITYLPVSADGQFDWDLSEDFDDPDALDYLQNQTCAVGSLEPLKSYSDGSQDAFYIRLHITTDAGEYNTDAALIQREATTSLPGDVTVVASYPHSMCTLLDPAQYHVTVRENCTKEELLALLPNTLPIQVQLLKSHGNLVGTYTLAYQVEWNLPDAPLTEDITVENAAKALHPPESAVLKTLNGSYQISSLPLPVEPLQLVIHTVPADVKAAPMLHSPDDRLPDQPLYLTFPLKPSGAARIVPFYSLDSGETWTASHEIIARNDAIDAVPKNADYRYAALFDEDDTPYREFLSGTQSGFLVRLEIEGGTFDGQSEILKWPADYNYEPPPKDQNPSGSGGNKGDVGSNNGSGGSEENGGQRPNLPGGIVGLPPVQDPVTPVTPVTPITPVVPQFPSAPESSFWAQTPPPEDTPLVPKSYLSGNYPPLSLHEYKPAPEIDAAIPPSNATLPVSPAEPDDHSAEVSVAAAPQPQEDSPQGSVLMVAALLLASGAAAVGAVIASRTAGTAAGFGRLLQAVKSLLHR